MDHDIEAAIAAYMRDASVAWSLGSFGAIAEFMRKEGEPVRPAFGHPLSLVSAGGALDVHVPASARAIAYTTPSRHEARRSVGVALCMPLESCAMGRRTLITELGPDSDALREEDRDAILFDMGLGLLQVDVLVRSRDRETIDRLRACVGTSLFDPAQNLMRDLPRLSPHRVFVSRCGRIEVFQPIPAADGRSPEGPHTHVLPKLLKSGRTHAANIPIPDGLVPCLSIHFAKPDPDHLRADNDMPA